MSGAFSRRLCTSSSCLGSITATAHSPAPPFLCSAASCNSRDGIHSQGSEWFSAQRHGRGESPRQNYTAPPCLESSVGIATPFAPRRAGPWVMKSRGAVEEETGPAVVRRVPPGLLGALPVHALAALGIVVVVHKDPASSAASRLTLADMYKKHPDGVQEKLGGQPLVEL